jgi:glycosyltransferase involved in cell wall biosynthesis
MNPVISVIVPCYNQAHFLEECLQSVEEQSFTNWECVIVDDGSPDNTEEIGLKWQSKDERFVYVKKVNGGLSSARNYGIERAKGRYILPLDCDDKIGKDYIKLGLQVFREKENIGVVYSKARYFGAINRPWILADYDKKFLLCDNLIFCSAIYLREDWAKIGGYDVNMKYGWEDWEFWINMIYTTGKDVYRINYTGFYYRQKENSMLLTLGRDNTRQIKSYEYIFSKHKKLYEENFVHPIAGFKRMMELENRNRLLLNSLRKFKSLFSRS